MSDWTDGYVADVGYTYGYYPELNPLRIRLAFLRSGLLPPAMGTACELGFGQGMSANLHAAASVVQWHGTDFNPAQAAFAQELAAAAGAGARLVDQGFAEFCNRSDLPDFDFIGLHGIWSWINDENRQHIVDFVRRKLKVGGVLYASYNTLPGWAAFAPMRHLLTQHADLMGAEGHGIVNRIDGALEFAEKLLATKPGFVAANPQVTGRLNDLKKRDRHYLAHEYFNRDWHPMHVATMGEWLAPAKLSYACSAHYLDHVDDLNLTADQQTFLRDMPDRMLRESVRDMMVNQFFRRDYWVKGLRRADPLERADALRRQSLMLTTHRPDVKLKVTGMLGEAEMNEGVYAPILDLLADHQPKTIGEIERVAASLPFNKFIQCITLLVGSGHVSPVQADAPTSALRARTDRLNAHLLQRSRAMGDIQHLASPLTGGGVPMPRIPQLFLLARSQGHRRPEDWAQFAWGLMNQLKHRLTKDGKTLETPEENQAELLRQARHFEHADLPTLQVLQIA